MNEASALFFQGVVTFFHAHRLFTLANAHATKSDTHTHTHTHAHTEARECTTDFLLMHTRVNMSYALGWRHESCVPPQETDPHINTQAQTGERIQGES